MNTRTSVLIAVNRFHAACRRTRTYFFRDGVIRTDRLTFATFHTFVLIDHRTTVFHMDGTDGTDLLAWMRDTSPALICHFIYIILTHGAGRRNNLHQRRLIILIRNITLTQSTGNMYRLVFGTERHAHRQTHTLSGDRALTVNTISVQGHIRWRDLVWNRLNIIFDIVRLKCHLCHLRKNLSADFCNRGFNSSHAVLSFIHTSFFCLYQNNTNQCKPSSYSFQHGICT